MHMTARLLAVCALASFSGAAGAQFFAGHSPRGPGDADEMAYAADIEGPRAANHALLRVAPTFSIASAPGHGATAFRAGLTDAARALFGLSGGCDASQTHTFYHYLTSLGGVPWSVHNLDSRAPWRSLFYYHQPAGDPSGWKRPILVINDGLGIGYSSGVVAPRYAGENIAGHLAAAGHPVMIMALKGFDTTIFRGVWGVSGVEQYASMLRARGLDGYSGWVQDAHDAMCLLKRWHPGRSPGVTGVSKSASLAALTALFHGDVDRVYLASGFSEFERRFTSISTSWAYAPGQLLLFERQALLLALQGPQIRLSYSENDDLLYRVEALEGRVRAVVNPIRSGWGLPAVSQHNHPNGHYYDPADAVSFFGQ